MVFVWSFNHAQQELPDCALPRDPDANCLVGEIHGKLCLVAARDIASGEVLTVPPSDDEDSEEEEEEESDAPACMNVPGGFAMCPPGCPCPAGRGSGSDEE